MRELLQQLWNERFAVTAIILFAVGFTTLLLHRNLLKKIIGLNIMETAGYLLLTSLGYIENRLSPIILDGNTDPSLYGNPLPAGLVLTGIVVSVSVTAVMLALTVRLYAHYRSLNVDEIYAMAQKQEGE